MAMRELVSGGAACAVPGSSSASNPLGALANALIGSSSKTQERLNEIPTSTSTGTENRFFQQPNDPLRALPGTEIDGQFAPPTAQGSQFLRGFRGADQNGFAGVWDEVSALPPPPLQSGFPNPQQFSDGSPQAMLSNCLRAFVGSSREGIPLNQVPMPTLGLSEGDKQCIRDRSSIMARHIFADRSEDFINGQVNALLSTLDIDNEVRAHGPPASRFQELDNYWNESQGAIRPGPPHAADGWITEFNQNRVDLGGPGAWVNSFQEQHGANGWASEFEQEQRFGVLDPIRAANIPDLAAMEQTRMLAHTLAQNNDPKFQNSKFLQFMSKMSRGELIIDDNQVKPASASGDWATEFQEQYSAGPSWVNEFANNQASKVLLSVVSSFYKRIEPFACRQVNISHGPDHWANQYNTEREQNEPAIDDWANEFSKLQVNDWVEEYGQQTGEGGNDSWTSAYDDFLNEQVAAKQQNSKGVYEFSDMNPYVGHPNPLKEGQELFRKGLLSEAVLALEAEVMKNPENSEGWRLLGIAHAENDDDHQAIAAMMRAQEADPTNLEVLLALGVSHTNELEQAAALKYLYGWLHNHPKYGNLAPSETPSLFYADVAKLFEDAAQMSPEDADVHIVLGVLYNLSREYDKAIESFRDALKLKPQDYSLWNKLGATQANSIQGADAILAYQQALDLKPNYVRAWANMGISFANQGKYEDSIRYYVRALAMNPKADNAWQYLRISLCCASREDMINACDTRNLDLLQKEFPL
ncbi:Peroxisome biogenesis protein 5 [Linum grandiflorum]